MKKHAVAQWIIVQGRTNMFVFSVPRQPARLCLIDVVMSLMSESISLCRTSTEHSDSPTLSFSNYNHHLPRFCPTAPSDTTQPWPSSSSNPPPPPRPTGDDRAPDICWFSLSLLEWHFAQEAEMEQISSSGPRQSSTITLCCGDGGLAFWPHWSMTQQVKQKRIKMHCDILAGWRKGKKRGKKGRRLRGEERRSGWGWRMPSQFYLKRIM